MSSNPLFERQTMLSFVRLLQINAITSWAENYAELNFEIEIKGDKKF